MNDNCQFKKPHIELKSANISSRIAKSTKSLDNLQRSSTTVS